MTRLPNGLIVNVMLTVSPAVYIMDYLYRLSDNIILSLVSILLRVVNNEYLVFDPSWSFMEL